MKSKFQMLWLLLLCLEQKVAISLSNEKLEQQKQHLIDLIDQLVEPIWLYCFLSAERLISRANAPLSWESDGTTWDESPLIAPLRTSSKSFQPGPESVEGQQSCYRFVCDRIILLRHGVVLAFATNRDRREHLSVCQSRAAQGRGLAVFALWFHRRQVVDQPILSEDEWTQSMRLHDSCANTKESTRTMIAISFDRLQSEFSEDQPFFKDLLQSLRFFWYS